MTLSKCSLVAVCHSRNVLQFAAVGCSASPLVFQLSPCRRAPSTIAMLHNKSRYIRKEGPINCRNRLSTRHKSTSTSTSTSTTTLPVAASNQSLSTKADRLNPPATLSPPALETPIRDASVSSIKHYYTLGKAYLTFYKTGARHVWRNYRLTVALQDRYDPNPMPTAARAGILSRADTQLLSRSSHDIRRVPIFALVFIVFGEWTPLIVPFMSGIVPGPCRTPAQIQGDLQKLEARRQASFRTLTEVLDNRALTVERLSRDQVLHVCRSLGLLGMWAERIGVAGVMDGVGWLRRKLIRRVEYLLLDDELIRRDGGVIGLEKEELRRAASERGLDVLGPNEESLKETLELWVESLDGTGSDKVLRRVLTRFVHSKLIHGDSRSRHR